MRLNALSLLLRLSQGHFRQIDALVLWLYALVKQSMKETTLAD